MKYIRIFILLSVCMISKGVNAQLEFYIDTLEISNYRRDIKDEYNYEMMQGPYVVFNCVFINNTADTISSNLYSGEYIACYRYNDITYKYEMKNDFRMLIDPSPLMPYDSVRITISNYIFQYNEMNPYPNIEKHDFLPDLEKVLPTLRLIYKNNSLEIFSDRINKIIYGDDIDL